MKDVPKSFLETVLLNLHISKVSVTSGPSVVTCNWQASFGKPYKSVRSKDGSLFIQGDKAFPVATVYTLHLTGYV